MGVNWIKTVEITCGFDKSFQKQLKRKSCSVENRNILMIKLFSFNKI